jgi:uncharacterized membrane protein
MNEQDRQELRQLKTLQQSLRAEMEQLHTRIKRLESRLESAEPAAARPSEIPPPLDIAPLEIEPMSLSPSAPAPPPDSTAAVPPIIQEMVAPEPGVEASTTISDLLQRRLVDTAPTSGLQRVRGQCKNCLGLLDFPAQAVSEMVLCPHCLKPTLVVPLSEETAQAIGTEAVPSVEGVESESPATPQTQLQTERGADPLPPLVAEVTAESAKETSFEMRLGTYWFVRAGIVMVLTALAWAGYLAYEKYIPLLGPLGKISLLYVASGTLLGIGAWFQRRDTKEALNNYGQVVFAGGLAAVYFTTYVAHHIPALQVIKDASLDGALLLAWAGFIVWLADRKKSEVMALFAIGLAYYSSAITSIGQFTLYSNLVLTIATAFFLVRNQWATLSVASLIASYAGFAFWRFHRNDGWLWDARTEAELWIGNLFLAGYWMAFTAAAFLSRAESIARGNRAAFATMNNGAFFALVLGSMLHVHHGHFWKFALIFGSALLALALAARRFLADEIAVKNAYLTQGLLLITIGFIAKLTGHTLAAVLAAESVTLLLLSEQQRNPILRAGSYLTAVMAVGWGVAEMKQFDSSGLRLGAALGALLAFNAWWTRRHDARRSGPAVRPEPAYFAALALLMWLVTTWQNTTFTSRPPVLAIEAVVLTVSYHLLKGRELALFGQGFLVLGHALFAWGVLEQREPLPWWNPVVVIAATLAVSHWWQRQKVLDLDREISRFFQGLYALGVVAVLFLWLRLHFQPGEWLALTSLLAVAVTAYGVVTRAWLLAGLGQIFLLVSSWEFARQLLEGKPVWYFALAPIVTVFALALVAALWFSRDEEAESPAREPLLRASVVYRAFALAMSVWWVFKYIPAREQCWVFALLGALAFLLAGWRRNQEGLIFSGVFFAVTLAVFATLPARNVESVYWPNLLAFLLLPVLQRIARRRPERFLIGPGFHGAVIVPAALVLWLYLTRWVMPEHGLYLVVCWSLLAVAMFGAGLGLRERPYRLLGFVVLATALGHVVLLDVWKESIFWANLLPIALVLGLQQMLRRSTASQAEPPFHVALILGGGLSLWLFLSRWVVLVSREHFLLTATWAALALVIFGGGFALRERMYRWLGLGILASAVGRAFLSDVWKLPTIYRILSFMALGVVLLALGFIYNKYQEKIKEWL